MGSASILLSWKMTTSGFRRFGWCSCGECIWCDLRAATEASEARLLAKAQEIFCPERCGHCLTCKANAVAPKRTRYQPKSSQANQFSICGHPKTPENTRKRAGGRAACLECERRRDRDRAKQARRIAAVKRAHQRLNQKRKN